MIKPPRRNYQTLDAIVVCACLLQMAFIFWALIFRNIPQSQLAIVSGLAGTVFGGTVGAYSAARWQSKKDDDSDKATA